MVEFTTVSVLAEGENRFFTGVRDLDIQIRNGEPVLYVASGRDGGITSFRLTPSGPVLLDQDAYSVNQAISGTILCEDLTLGGQTVIVPLGGNTTALPCFDLGGDGQIIGTAQIQAQGGFPAPITHLESVTLGARELVYVAHADMPGITVYEADSNGQLIPQGAAIGLDGGAPEAVLTQLTSVEVNGNSFVLGMSTQTNRLESYRLDTNGIPQQVDMLDPDGGLSVSDPTQFVHTTVEGVTYVILAAAGTDSLTVLEVTSSGQFVPVDHVLDDLNTRFQGGGALETITVDGQVYVVAGGADDGLSLFTLLPGGRLVHLGQIADSADTALTNVTALALHVDGSELQIFASGEGEVGVSHVRVDLSAQGDILEIGDGDGGAGDDILIDGAGSDTLRGGAGADIFVLGADGQSDTIIDFELGRDRLDLATLIPIHSLRQVSIEETAWGARVRYGNEEVRIYSVDGLPLAAAQFQVSDFAGLAHYQLVRGTFNEITDGDENPNELTGTEANDVFDGRGGDDMLDGQAGNDSLDGGSGNDTLLGGDGTDTLRGETGNDQLEGGADADLLDGGSGNDTLTGGAGLDTLRGDTGNDRLEGGDGADFLDGGSGSDRLFGQNGNDTLLGNDGRDGLFGADGADELRGGAGNDTLFGHDGHDVLSGDGGRDTLYGGSGNDTLYGGWFSDFMNGEDGNDVLNGDGGLDHMLGGAGHDTMRGGDGNDTAYGQTGADSMEGGAGDDRLFAGQDNDYVDGGAGNDTILGEAGSDRMFAGDGNDLMFGGWFSDWMYGQAGDDVLYGEGGLDRLFGGLGNDTLYGGDNEDVLFGANQDDVLYGGAANDILNGEGGRDTLDGGAGNDQLTGGWYSDTFVFRDGFGRDVITDFDPDNLNERIDLRGVSAITSLTDLYNNHMVQIGSDVQIRDLQGNVITVENVTLAQLQDGNDFLI